MEHMPVLLEECLHGLQVRPWGMYVDGTLGRGGHSRGILEQGGRLIAIDRDLDAINSAGRALAQYGDRFTPIHGNFGDISEILGRLNVKGVDGMLFDLGVSSPQLDEAARGFSYTRDAPLDMRMDQSGKVTARDVVNEWPQEELRRIFFEYGEERYASRIAESIVRARMSRPIETTLELTELIRAAMPAAALREKQHPAKRCFQAIRIAVNDELGEIERMLTAAEPLLLPGGRLCVITFHSLEDRIVKQKIQEYSRGCTCPPEFPVCICGKKPRMKNLTRRPIVPGPEELMRNPRSRSAKLRIAEKL